MLGKHVSLCPAGHEEDSCRTLSYATEYTTKSSFCMQTIKPYPSSDSIYLRARSVTFTPASNPFWGERIVFHAVLFFPHVPPSCCESQYDLSERVRGKWADRCQLLYPGAGEDPRACQRTPPRRWRLLSMLCMTAMKGYTLTKVNDPPVMFFFSFAFILVKTSKV